MVDSLLFRRGRAVRRGRLPFWVSRPWDSCILNNDGSTPIGLFVCVSSSHPLILLLMITAA